MVGLVWIVFLPFWRVGESVMIMEKRQTTITTWGYDDGWLPDLFDEELGKNRNIDFDLRVEFFPFFYSIKPVQFI